MTLLRHYRKMLTLTTILTLTLLLILTLTLTLMFQYNFWMYYRYFQNSLVITVILKDDGTMERRSVLRQQSGLGVSLCCPVLCPVVAHSVVNTMGQTTE